MELVTAALLIVGGFALAASVRLSPSRRDALAPVMSFLATILLVIGVSWVIRGPSRPVHGPALVVLAQVGASYGAIAAGACLAFPARTPKILQALVGVLCATAGVLLLLFQFRVLKP